MSKKLYLCIFKFPAATILECAMLLNLVSWRVATQGNKSRKPIKFSNFRKSQQAVVESEISLQFLRLLTKKKCKLMCKRLKINIFIKPDTLKKICLLVKKTFNKVQILALL